MLKIIRNDRSFSISDKNKQKNWWLNTYPKWELDTSGFMEAHCIRDKITLDIGSWNGVHAFYMSLISKEVYAIEADPSACAFLDENLECNPGLSPRIKVCRLALSNNCGTVKIMAGGGSGSSILPSVQDKHGKIPTVDVECVTFKEFLSRNSISPEDIGFIKMDIEGAEKFCIPDMEWFLKDYTGAVCLSLHQGFMSDEDLRAVIAIMSKYFTRVSNEGWIRK